MRASGPISLSRKVIESGNARAVLTFRWKNTISAAKKTRPEGRRILRVGVVILRMLVEEEGDIKRRLFMQGGKWPSANRGLTTTGKK